MRRAFALFEALLALVVFSILLIGGAKLFLTLTQDRKIYGQQVEEGVLVQNAFFLLQNLLSHSFLIQTSSSGLTFYPLDTQAYFSTTFSLKPQFLSSQKLSLSYNPINTAFLLSIPEQQLYAIRRKVANTLEFDVIKGEYFLPLQSKEELTYTSSVLRLDGQPLLIGLKRFEIKLNAKYIEILACINQCYEYSFKLGNLYEKI